MNNVSVIVLSYNTKDITDECLKRVKEAGPAEVIVVDNASTDGSPEMIKKKYPSFKLIVSKINTGFAGGNNIGMEASTKQHILLLNSDAYIEKDTIFKALQYFETHPDCAVLGCKLVLPDGRMQPSAGFLPTPLNTVLWISGLARFPFFDKFARPIHPKDKTFFTKAREVEWVMGAFFILKREVFEETHGFDGSIFMYGEEVEWCKRIRNKGLKTFYVPNFQITHLDKASSKFEVEKPLLNEIKGVVRFFKKHYAEKYPLIKAVLLISLCMRLMVFIILGKWQRVRAYKDALGIL